MTAAQQTPAPANVIKPRRMAFDMDQLQEKYFFHGNSILSTLMYALSASFPDGERFFIDSVRHYQKRVEDPVLSAQIRGFIGQEAHHSKIHEDFNARAEELGIPMTRIEKRFKKRTAMARKNLTHGQQLAVTAALEHITATLAQWTLENPELGVGNHSHSPLREMLIWHAMEEIEHKAVAFDVYRSVVGDEKQRIAVARIVFRTFWWEMAQAQISLLWNDRKMPSRQEIREAWQFMWGEGGFRAWSQPEFKRYLAKGFHPNDIDHSALLAQWHDNYPEVAALQFA